MILRVKRETKLFLILIFLLFLMGFSIKAYISLNGWVSFHYDMARDAFVARQIWESYDLKILGPPTSTQGLYHGVLYYYLIALFYFIGQGDPRAASLGLSFINSLAVIPFAILAKEFFKSIKWAILVGLLFIVSFEANQYGPWISNPSPAFLTISCFYLGLWRMYTARNKDPWLIFTTFWAVLSVHFQFFLIHLLVVLVVFCYLFIKGLSFRGIIKAILVVFLGLSSFLLAAIKFGTIDNIFNPLMGSKEPSEYILVSFSTLALNYLNRIADMFTLNLTPFNTFLGGVIALVCFGISFRNRFLIFLLLSNFILFIFGGHSNNYVNIGMITPVLLSFGLLISSLKRYKALLIGVVLIIIFTNLNLTIKLAPMGQQLFVIQKNMLLENELRVIDRTYELARGRDFAINTMTVPFWTNTTWSYLYWYYGLKKYGYVPSFYGRDQVGLLGKEVHQQSGPKEVSFFIIEPMVGIASKFIDDDFATEDSKTVLDKEENFGGIRLQVRQVKSIQDAE